MGLEMKCSRNLLSPLGIFWVLFVGLVSLTVWTFVFEIDKSIGLSGSVRPLNASSGIQTLSGGRIKSFVLETGMTIQQGDLVATFDFSEQTQKLAELTKQMSSLSVLRDRLIAALDGAPTFVYKDNYNQEFYEIQKKIFSVELEASDREKRAIGAQIDSLYAQMRVLSDQITASKAEVSLNDKKTILVSRLFEKGFEGEIALLEAQQELDRAKLRTGELESQYLQLAAEIGTLQEKIIQVDNSFARKLAAELYQVGMQIEQLTSEKNILEAQIRKQNLISSADGRITKVNIESVGQVVDPGFTLAEYVPSDTEMAFEIMISPQHINDIQIGQVGKVVLSNMDTRSGERLEGRVVAVDGDVTIIEDGTRFYSGVVALSAKDSDVLVPGVDGTVAINVGKRTIASYFLEPILHAVAGAMSEK